MSNSIPKLLTTTPLIQPIVDQFGDALANPSTQKISDLTKKIQGMLGQFQIDGKNLSEREIECLLHMNESLSAYEAVEKSKTPNKTKDHAPLIQKIDGIYQKQAQKVQAGNITPKDISDILKLQSLLQKYGYKFENSKKFSDISGGVEALSVTILSESENLTVDQKKETSSKKSQHSSFSNPLEFKLQGTSFRIKPTRGQGSCAIHAVLGEEIDGVVRFSGDNKTASHRAKNHYTQTLNRYLSTHSKLPNRENDPVLTSFSEGLKSYLISASTQNGEAHSKMLFPETSRFMKNWQNFQRKKEVALATLNDEEMQIWMPVIIENHNKILDALMEEANGPSNPFYGRNQEEVIKRMNTADKTMRLKMFQHFVGIKNEMLLRLESHSSKELIEKIQEKKTDQNQRLDNIELDFFLDPQLIKHYLETVMRPGYYLDTQEIRIIAYLFNKEVHVVHNADESRQRKIVPCELPMNSDKQLPVVVVHHYGAHFSQCHLIHQQSSGLTSPEPEAELDLTKVPQLDLSSEPEAEAELDLTKLPQVDLSSESEYVFPELEAKEKSAPNSVITNIGHASNSVFQAILLSCFGSNYK